MRIVPWQLWTTPETTEVSVKPTAAEVGAVLVVLRLWKVMELTLLWDPENEAKPATCWRSWGSANAQAEAN